ncbi:MAG TPA: DUF1501 domain-containing protein [Planctomycetaceae bacterium]|nr:DUF1501 domain-containing protein [Planctomycetaceae bacterium]
MYTRRHFLGKSLQFGSVVSLASSIPCFLSRSLQAAENVVNDGRILVVIELSGGNDGLNTVVPFADENYEKFRNTIRVPKSQVLKLNDEIGLHPAMDEAAKLVEDGRLAIVQGVGYPNPNRSHFESSAIWQSAQLNPQDLGGYGWLGRALDVNSNRVRTFADSISLGDFDPPLALRGRRSTQSAIRKLEELQLDSHLADVGSTNSQNASDDLLQFVRRRTVDAQATAARIAKLTTGEATSVSYPGSELGTRLKSIARLIRAELEPRVYYTQQSGYDTHIDQYNDHFQLLGQFSSSLNAFLNDLKEAKLDDRVLVLVFSEFGRRVEENDSQGTDHGTAGPMFLAGPAVKAGLHGQTPDLTNLEDGDLKMTTDFRSVYATILSQWLSIDPAKCLSGQFETLELLRV